MFRKIGEIRGFGLDDDGREGEIGERRICGHRCAIDADGRRRGAQIHVAAAFEPLLQVDEGVDADDDLANEIHFRHAESAVDDEDERLEAAIVFAGKTGIKRKRNLPNDHLLRCDFIRVAQTFCFREGLDEDGVGVVDLLGWWWRWVWKW